LTGVKRTVAASAHPWREDLITMTAGLKLLMLFTIAVGFFASFAYMPFVPTLIALIYGMSYTAERELQLIRTVPAGAVTPAAMASQAAFPATAPAANIWARATRSTFR